ncbi:hypothetical protein D0T08_25325 [Emticicia sp. C21]|nr:hypothetical protein D0T08_25325 [Emticicia sp. C21]
MRIKSLLKRIHTVCCCLGASIFFNFFLYSVSLAQSTHLLSDSMLLKPPDAPKRGLGFVLNWDARRSFVKNQRVNIWGVNTGIVFGKKRNQITVGYYWLNFNSYQKLIDFRRTNSKLVNLDSYTKTDLYFFSLMYWKNFIETRRWRVSMPVEVGIGATKNQGTELLTEIQIWKRKDFFLPVQSGLYAKWKATRWVGLSIQGGYRYALISQNIQQNYDGFYYSFGAELQPELFRDVYRWLFKGKKTEATISTQP